MVMYLYSRSLTSPATLLTALTQPLRHSESRGVFIHVSLSDTVSVKNFHMKTKSASRNESISEDAFILLLLWIKLTPELQS